MTSRTLNVLRQLGNASHDDYAQAYLKALKTRVSNLQKLYDIQAMPWYDRILFYREIKRLISAIHHEHEFLTYCLKTIDWQSVKDNNILTIKHTLGPIHQKYIRLTGLNKTLKLYE